MENKQWLQISRENTSTEKQPCLHKQLWGGRALDLHKEAMQHANRKGGALSSGSGDLGLSPSWSLVKYTHDLEIKCVNQMRDHPAVIHRAARESEPCIWGRLCQVRADYKMSPDDKAFFLIPSVNKFQRKTNLHRIISIAPASLSKAPHFCGSGSPPGDLPAAVQPPDGRFLCNADINKFRQAVFPV